jgi:probable rRNA maturation factor
MTAYVEIQNACKDDDIPADEQISAWVSRALQAVDRATGVELTVRVVAIDEMRELNLGYRQKDKPTNVLSFPAGAIEGLPAEAGLPLGDIVVCAAVVRTEADSQGKSLADHWAHMIVHGTLHLLGFDHEDDGEAVEMEALEKDILASHGVANPYAETRQDN